MKTKYLFSIFIILLITFFVIYETAEATNADASQAEPIPSLLTAAGPGGSPHVRAFNTLGVAESEPNKLMAYASSYRGGVRVTAGDIDNDGVDEIITGTGENGGPHLRVFEKNGTARGIEFFPFHASFRGGMDVASGDFDGDGKDDIAVSQFSNGQSWVKVYRYNSNKDILFEKKIFASADYPDAAVPECGATIALGQLDSDLNKELIVGAGNGCAPRVVTYDYKANDKNGTLKPISFYAFDSTILSGIDVAAGDVDGDGKDEIAVSRLKDSLPFVYVFRYNANHTQLASFKAYGDYQIGANVTMADIDNDGQAEIITGAGPGGGPQVRAFEYDGTIISSLNKFFAYDSRFRGGVDVGVGNF